MTTIRVSESVVAVDLCIMPFVCGYILSVTVTDLREEHDIAASARGALIVHMHCKFVRL